MPHDSDATVNLSERIAVSRRALAEGLELPIRPLEAEGGCGVLGAAASFPIEGRHLLAPLRQMRNRGNGKGGGVAMVGLDPAQWGVDRATLARDYILQVAYLDPSVRPELEGEFITPVFEVDSARPVEPRTKGPPGLVPSVILYFVRPKTEALREFVQAHGLEALEQEDAGDELMYQNTFRLHRRMYASLGEKKAFVLSHGKDMLNFKLVGHAEDAIAAYGLEDAKAHVWIGHHRYPTKGKVWHPGGAHPFIGVNEALVHNGDFANYASICDSLAQRGVYPLFLTDTEVSALLFDLLRRTCGYSLEHVIEALAPTTDRDFERLDPERKAVFKRLQQAHIHSSPDGPWFFILASHDRKRGAFELIGITDTSMLRPQVFALQEGEHKVGAIASEKQAIDAFFRSLHEDGKVPCPAADLYWNARGGSYTDGGAFVFSVTGDDRKELATANKFGRPIRTPAGQSHASRLEAGPAAAVERARKGGEPEFLEALSRLDRVLDRRLPAAGTKRSSVAHLAEAAVSQLLCDLPQIGSPGHTARIDFARRQALAAPPAGCSRLAVDGREFPAEGDESLARFVVQACALGWRRLLLFGLRGQRFIGCGLGASAAGTRIDVYGSPGDYLASGLDGGDIRVHGSAQDQVGNILKAGKLVVAGDVGQAFLYAAKGGEVYVLGNAAGRPLINAVGSPKVVINGTALDYLAESFMAGDPLQGGGFVVLNGMEYDLEGTLREKDEPYPGGNLFSLASGGAVYIRDPRGKVCEDQLNGGRIVELAPADWRTILPLLQENERLFGVPVEALLTIDGAQRDPRDVYRKVEAVSLKTLKA